MPISPTAASAAKQAYGGQFPPKRRKARGPTTPRRCRFASEPATLYHVGTLRGGQSLHNLGNIVVVGDVNPGAELVASGDIVVFGALRGVAHAGAQGDAGARVYAIELAPTQSAHRNVHCSRCGRSQTNADTCRNGTRAETIASSIFSTGEHDVMSARKIVFTSGKGGVGKTTTTVNVGAALAKRGQRVILVDADIGLRNLDLVLGLEKRIVFDLVEVVEGRCQLRQALIKDKRFESLSILPAAQTREKDAVSEEQMAASIDELARTGGLRADRLPGRHRARLSQRRRRRGRSDRRDDA